jgi:hypothetical protein
MAYNSTRQIAFAPLNTPKPQPFRHVGAIIFTDDGVGPKNDPIVEPYPIPVSYFNVESDSLYFSRGVDNSPYYVYV